MDKESMSVVNQESSDEQTNLDRTLQREINLAKNIQTKLLNGPPPKVNGGEVKGISVPARMIGGDYYDFYPLENGKLRIVIGDVMGKGIPAAMLMILTRGAFRSAAGITNGPGETLTAMNNALFKDLRSLKSFVTVLCADWDPETNTLIYASAGHCMPLHLKKGENVVEDLPRVPGIMVGGLQNQMYKEGTVFLEKEDTVFFYTDGIIEAVNTQGEQFKRDRLVQTLAKDIGKLAEEIEISVMEALHMFTEGTHQKDDITMVLLKIQKETSDGCSSNSPVMYAEG